MSSETPAPVLPEKKKSKTGLIVGISAGVVVLLGAVAAFVVPGLLDNDSEAAAGEKELTTVSIGVTNEADEYWSILQDLALEEGIKVELVNFTEYPLPNPALAAEETDLNSFQHLDYLSNHIVATGDDLVPISPTIIVPLPLYSTEYDSVEDIPEGAEIAIPNDESNQGRAINVLVSAGLVELKNEVDIPTPADIDESASKVTVTPISAEQTPAALQTVAGAVINNNFALDAGLDPLSALYYVDPSDPLSAPYLNVIVARAEDADNPAYLKVAELWHTKEVTDAVLASSKNTAVLVDATAEELQKSLDALVEKKKAQQ